MWILGTLDYVPNIFNKNQPFRFSRYNDGLKGKCRNTPFFQKYFEINFCKMIRP